MELILVGMGLASLVSYASHRATRKDASRDVEDFRALGTARERGQRLLERQGATRIGYWGPGVSAHEVWPGTTQHAHNPTLHLSAGSAPLALTNDAAAQRPRTAPVVTEAPLHPNEVLLLRDRRRSA